MKKTLYLLVCLCMMALVSSCKSTKKMPKATDVPAAAESELTLEKDRYETLLNNAYDFGLLQSKAKFSLGSTSLSGRLNVEHGKRLCMSVSVIGIEVARVEVNTKTVTVVDKFDKLYAELTFKDFAKQLGLEDELQYDALESILLGRMFIPGSGVAQLKDFKKLNWTIGNNSELTGVIAKPRYTLTYSIDEENHLTNTCVMVNGASESSVSCAYSDYLPIDGGLFATNETLNIASEKLKIKANLSLSAPTMGKNWVSFTPNESYRKATIQEVISAVKNMKN